MEPRPDPPPPEPTGEAGLVLRAQLGDRAALSALITSTIPWLRPYLRRVLLNRADADDVLQEALLTVFRRLALLNEPRAYRAWVYRIASRLAFRQSGRTPPTPAELDEWPAHDREPLDREELARIKREVSALSPNTRAAIALHYYEGLSIRRVAAVLAIPEGTAKSRIAAGLEILRRTTREKPP